MTSAQPATHLCEGLERKGERRKRRSGERQERRELAPTLSTPPSSQPTNPSHWSFLPETLPDVTLLGRLGVLNPKMAVPFDHEFFRRAHGTYNSSTKRRRPRSLHPKYPTPGQPAAKDEHSAEFLRIVEFPYAAVFHQEPPRAQGRLLDPHMRSQRLSPAGLGEEAWSATALLVQKYAALRLIVLLPVVIYPQ